MTCDHAHQRRRSRPWWAPPVGAGIFLLAVAAWGILAHQTRLPQAGPPPALAYTAKPAVTAQIPTAATAAGGVRRPGAAAPAPSQTPAAPPMPVLLPAGAESVQIPSLQISASALAESVTSGALGVPGNPAGVGWWMPSPAELVIDGHVDMEGVGPGALYEVRNLRPGASVTVQTATGREHWTINGVRTYKKGNIPAGLFSDQQMTPRLLIITCGGPFDYATHHYYDNVIAYASLSRA